MNSRLNNLSIESFLVMTLLVVFAIAMSIVIVRGSDSYERLLDNKENEENSRIALSYMNMMVKQHDRQDSIFFEEDVVEGIDALVIVQEDDFKTYIYHHDGYLKACYTDEEPIIELSESIIPVQEMVISLEDQLIQVYVAYDGSNDKEEITRYISYRSN